MIQSLGWETKKSKEEHCFTDLYRQWCVSIDMTGIDFAMTALFLVMFTDQWEKTRNHKPALTGLGCSAACLAVFGSGNFILPSMACIILCLLANRKTNDKEAGEQ